MNQLISYHAFFVSKELKLHGEDKPVYGYGSLSKLENAVPIIRHNFLTRYSNVSINTDSHLDINENLEYSPLIITFHNIDNYIPLLTATKSNTYIKEAIIYHLGDFQTDKGTDVINVTNYYNLRVMKIDQYYTSETGVITRVVFYYSKVKHVTATIKAGETKKVITGYECDVSKGKQT